MAQKTNLRFFSEPAVADLLALAKADLARELAELGGGALKLAQRKEQIMLQRQIKDKLVVPQNSLSREKLKR